MSSQAEIREHITQQIVEALKAGTPPWRKPWSDLDNTGHPANIVSKRSYCGVNPLLLDLVARERGYQSRWWGTFRQWQSLGLRVKARPYDVQPGAWGTKVIFCKPVTKTTLNKAGEEAEDQFFVLRTYTVFSAEQTEGPGVEKFLAKPRVGNAFVDYQPAEEAIAATGADIRFGGNRAVYCPEPDYIQMPLKASFVCERDYYATCAHELIHWAGHKSRLNRLDQNARFGNAAYAFEELVAEVGGCFACTELGIPQSGERTNQEAYLGHWLQVLQNDHSAIFRASSQASKAVDYILAFSRGRGEAGACDHPLAAASVVV